ncbi:hypothetical protein N7466_000376 [Penicillium verhagenii]|uniref:uncharacterized protein n=1 Tax=Penicillium verhagenii TaxID=1562060 RepID=UPI0025451D33|nr:uncharacterized protein N7466_000376 [Penicillium verhagenii]KAJ5947361.1 hypothetical protein N7466_000376 [Penicillium verhagenii]
MTFQIMVHAYRKAGMSPGDFKKHYDSHVDLLKRIAGDVFPLSHKRMYVARTSVDIAAEGASSSNATTPAAVIVGEQSDFEFDAFVELTFHDEKAFLAFVEKCRGPEFGPQVTADEELFLDRLAVVAIGEVSETTA